jgi:hypothetical protein
VIQKEMRKEEKKETYSTYGQRLRESLRHRTTSFYLRIVVAMENIDRAKSQVMISFADQSKRESVRGASQSVFSCGRIGGYRFVVFTFSVFTFFACSACVPTMKNVKSGW